MMVSGGNAAGDNHFLRCRRPERRERLQFETLETRYLLSANPLTVDVGGAGGGSAALAAVVATTQVTNLGTAYTAPIGYTPAQIAAAYGFNQIKFGSVVGNGAGQTIAIVDAYNDPDIAGDLQTFDKQFNLAAPKFTEVKQTLNGQGPMNSAGWSMEISLDVEWAHAMAPAANIELIEAYSPTLSNLLTCVQYAAAQPGVSVVSMSWGASEFSSEANYNSYFTTPAGHTGVSFVASSGDSGAGALWPAISTNVLSVGGTSLTLNKNGTYGSETAWAGSGGGGSQYQSEASYEKGVQTTGKQMDPDVAYDANPSTGFAVYDTVPDQGYSGWLEVGGTSAGAPQWSALVAIANQGRVLNHENTLTNAAAAVFSISSNDFHDVTSGSDGGHSATKGYDEVTGLGTPQANLVAQGLLGVTAAQQTYTSITASGTSGSSSVVSQKVDLASFDDASSLLAAGVVFTQNQVSTVTGTTGQAALLVSSSAGALAASGRTSTPQGAELTLAATTLIGSSGGDLATTLDESGSFDAAATVGPATSMDLVTTAGARLAPAAAGLAVFMSEDSVMRVDASFATDTEWANPQWTDGLATQSAAISPSGVTTDRSAESDDAEAAQLSAVLLAVGAVLTTVRSNDSRENQPAEDDESRRRHEMAV
ncbi:MAG TPA: LEPR-XLL domain-containing protein [Pirellulales bacterium]